MKRFILVLIVLLGADAIYAFDDVDTHPKLTEKATKNSALVNSLSQNLDDMFSNNYESLINGKKVVSWLTDGSTAEDNPWCKASSHFHDPLKAWLDAGLSGLQVRVVVRHSPAPCGRG